MTRKVKTTATILLLIVAATVLFVWTLLAPGNTSLFKVYMKRINDLDAFEKPNTLSDILKCTPFSAPPTNVTVQGQTCEQLINEKIAIAGAISSHYLKAGKDMIASVQHFYPNLHIIIYDLGLTQSDLETLATFCNVHIRQFNFSKYPDFVKNNLHTCSWKPLIALELSKEFEFIFYYDASIRLMKPIVDIVLPLFKDFPFIPGSAKKHAGNPIIITTHDGMLEYLNITQSREELEEFGLVEAGLWAMMVNDELKSKILEPWVDCALHKECIAPEGAKKPCDPVKESDPKGAYRGCHRFDQSALDLILVREFGINVWDNFHAEETKLALKVDRTATIHYTIKTC